MCDEWTGATTPDGYPRRAYRGNSNTRWHRVVYCQANGLELEDIAGQVVRHTCDNIRCVDPAHLVIGSVADNMRDRDLRDRHGKARVSLPLAREIVRRLSAGESGYRLAEELDLPSSTIYYQRVRVRRLVPFAE